MIASPQAPKENATKGNILPWDINATPKIPLYAHFRSFLILLFVLIGCFVFTKSIAQIDTTKPKLSFDFGLARIKNNNIWPIYKYSKRNGRSDLEIFFSLYMKTKDSVAQARHLHILPFFINDTAKGTVNNRFLSLYYPSLFHYTIDRANKVNTYHFIELAPHISLLAASESANGLFVENNFFFFVSFMNDKVHDRSHFVVFPEYWHFATSKSSTTLFVPFYYSHKDPIDYRQNILLLYNKHTTPTSSSTSLFPVWSSRKTFTTNDTITRNNYLFLYRATKSKARDNHILLPLLYDLKSPKRHSFTLFPLFSYTHHFDSSQKKYLNILGAYWHTKDTASSKSTLFPVWFSSNRFLKHDTLRSRVLFPFYWDYKNKDSRSTVVFPIIYDFKNKYYPSLTVFPFYSKGKSTDSTRGHLGILNYWQFYAPNYKARFGFPLYWSSIRKLKADTIKSNVFFPVYWSFKRKESKSTVVFPFVYSFKNKQFNSLTVFPFYSKGITADSSRGHLGILNYWKFHAPNYESKFLFPFCWSSTRKLKTDTIKSNVFFPVYWSFNRKESMSTIVFPFAYYFKNRNYHSFTLFPVFSVGASPGYKRSHLGILNYWHFKDYYKTSNVLFPIYWDKRQYLGKDTISSRILFPFYWSYKSNAIKRETVFPFYFYKRAPLQHTTTILPFYHRNVINDSTRTRNLMVMGLYWQFANSAGSSSTLFPLWWTKKEFTDKDTITRKTFFPIYWSVKSKESSSTSLFPLLYLKRDTGYKSFTFFPLFSVGRSPDGTKSHWMVTPLVGGFHSPNKSHFYIFPLWSQRKIGDTTKTSVLLVLYKKTKSPQFTSSSFIWPIVHYEKNLQSVSFHIAPIVWSRRTDTSNLFSIQPFFYSYKTTTDKRFSILWQLYRHENEEGKFVSNSFLWRFYSHATYTNGDFENKFLYFIYTNNKKDGKREKGIFPFFHRITYSNGDKHFSSFFGFFNRSRQYMPELKGFYEEEKIFWFLRFRSNYKELHKQG